MTEFIKKINQTLQSDPNTRIIKDLETNRWHSKKEIRASIQAIQNTLAQQAVKSGDLVLLSLPNSYNYILAFLALLDYGCVVSSIDPSMPQYKLEQYILRNNYRFAFFSENHLTLMKTNHAASLGKQPLAISEIKLQTSPLFFCNLSHPAKEASLAEKISSSDEETLAILLYTSGTTGRPKAVGLTHQQVLSSINNIIYSHKLSSKDRTYICLPLFHINAQVISLLSPFLSGGKIIVGPKFSASKFWDIINEENISWVSVAPAIISILLKTKNDFHKNSSLRFVRSASAPLPVTTAKKFEEAFQTPIIESYGMTEAASQICVNPVDPDQRVLGSVGIPIGVELKIVDEIDQKVSANIIGEIAVRGASVITHYLRNENPEDFKDGWFHTGDIGYQNKAGFVFLVGRKKEMINRSGEKISPYEVENVLLQLDIVEQCAVIGQPDEIYGEKVVAYIVLSEAAARSLDKKEDNLRAILQHCKNSLSLYKCPSDIKLVTNLPVGPTGKILRKKIKASS